MILKHLLISIRQKLILTWETPTRWRACASCRTADTDTVGATGEPPSFTMLKRSTAGCAMPQAGRSASKIRRAETSRAPNRPNEPYSQLG